MLAATSHARPLRQVREKLEASFPDDFSTLDGGCVKKARALQKLFVALVRIARGLSEVLRQEIAEWRQQVTRGEIDFDSERESGYKDSLCAMASLMDRLHEKAEAYRRTPVIFLAKPALITNLLTKKAKLEKILSAWKAPEWEVVGMRTVKWNREQTIHLMERLGQGE